MSNDNQSPDIPDMDHSGTAVAFLFNGAAERLGHTVLVRESWRRGDDAAAVIIVGAPCWSGAASAWSCATRASRAETWRRNILSRPWENDL